MHSNLNVAISSVHQAEIRRAAEQHAATHRADLEQAHNGRTAARIRAFWRYFSHAGTPHEHALRRPGGRARAA